MGEKRITKLGKSLASASMSRRIQTNTNGTFKKLVNGEQIGNAVRGEINLIIINALPKVSRVYYAAKYDPNAEATLPNCWSNLGDKPEPQVPEPGHTNCADCEFNIKGSGDNGSKACRFQRRISVLIEGDMSGDIYQFNIPAKSLFGKGTGNVHPFESYMKYLIANGYSPDTVVTNVQYDLEADSMELQFTPVRGLEDDEYNLVVACQEKPECERYTHITVAEADGVVAQPVKVKESSKPEPKPEPKPKITRSEEPEEDEEEEAPIPEPVKRKTSKKAEVVDEESKEAKLANAISDWVEEDGE
jgi:hypothetical protein